MAENFGGPVWHASGLGRTPGVSRQIALDGLRGVGNRSLGEWISEGIRPGIVHVQRRLSEAECEAFAVPEPYDIRGTDEEIARVRMVLAEAPYLAERLMRI